MADDNGVPSAAESLGGAFERVGIDQSDSGRDSSPVEEEERKLGPDPRYEWEAKQEAGRRKAAQSIVDSMENVHATEQAFEESRSARDTLREILPGMSFGDLMKEVELIQTGFETDPYGMAEKLQRWALGYPPQFREKKQAGERDNSFRGSFDRAVVDVGDRDQLEAAMQKYGGNLGHILSQTAGALKMILDDPVGGVARILPLYGVPTTPQHQQEAAQTFQVQQQVSHLTEGIQRVVDAGKMPGLEREGVQVAVAEILESKEFQRTGDPAADLYAAWELAMDRAAKEGAEAIRAKAGKSISGSPGFGAQQATRQSKPPTTREALARALGAI